MAITKIAKNFAPKSKEIRYLVEGFPDWRQNLIDFTKVYFPDTYSDFNESSPGMMFIEQAAYVGDVLSYYINSQFKENLMQFAEERNNVINIAQSVGYKAKPSSASTTDAEFFQVVPALSSGQNFAPDERFYLRIAPGMIVSAVDFGTITFRTTAEINFADPFGREVIVYTVNGSGQPLSYLAKKTATISSGIIRTFVASVAAPTKFSVITIPDDNVLEIISIIDTNGNVWSETDFLAQDLIFDDSANLSIVDFQSPQYVVKAKRTPRRFVTRYNTNSKLEIHFGSGVIDDSSELVSLDSRKIASDEYQSRLASTTLDPSDFLSSTSYGLAPSNTDLTITYAVGGGVESNVPSNTISQVSSRTISNDTSALNTSERGLFTTLTKTLAVNNPEPASGGKGADTIEEIRQQAMAFFNSQNRVVNAADYVSRVHAMPPKYGSVAKAYVVQDEQITKIMQSERVDKNFSGTFVVDSVNPNAINLYTLGFDAEKKLTVLNSQVKQNLKIYLDQYRMLTDQINLLDAFVVDIGVNFKVTVFKNENLNEVLTRCIDAIVDFFDIDRWSINQPIVINDLQSHILQVQGVQSVVTLEIVNKYFAKHGAGYQPYIYDISSATDINSGVIYPSLDPCIFELRYPQSDIVGAATQ